MESGKPPKRIDWEDFEHELARLCSLSSAVKEAKEKKLILQRKLESVIQVKAESLSRMNELEEMRGRLEARKSFMANMSMHCKSWKEESKQQEDKLASEVRSLLVAGTGLSMARKRLQESNRVLAEVGDSVKLKNVEKKLRMRQQYMISQVSLLYPVKMVAGPAQDQELESFPSSSRLGPSTGSRPVNHGSMTILGLHLSMVPFTRMSFFTDKKEVQKSATALGYIAHAVSLVASYLGVPLRYPLHFGCSHSYITDYSPSVESTSSDLSSNTALPANEKSVDFPLFLEGQDTTRAAYAVFLLNKDIEQLLNFIGLNSLGPRHVLANLKELLRAILSVEYIDT